MALGKKSVYAGDALEKDQAATHTRGPLCTWPILSERNEIVKETECTALQENIFHCSETVYFIYLKEFQRVRSTMKKMNQVDMME